MKKNIIIMLVLLCMVSGNAFGGLSSGRFSSIDGMVRMSELVLIGRVVDKVYVKELYDSAIPDENYIVKVKVEKLYKGKCKKIIYIRRSFHRDGGIKFETGQKSIYFLNTLLPDEIIKYQCYRLNDGSMGKCDLINDEFKYLHETYTLKDFEELVKKIGERDSK